MYLLNFSSNSRLIIIIVTDLTHLTLWTLDAGDPGFPVGPIYETIFSRLVLVWVFWVVLERLRPQHALK